MQIALKSLPSTTENPCKQLSTNSLTAATNQTNTLIDRICLQKDLNPLTIKTAAPSTRVYDDREISCFISSKNQWNKNTWKWSQIVSKVVLHCNEQLPTTILGTLGWWHVLHCREFNVVAITINSEQRLYSSWKKRNWGSTIVCFWWSFTQLHCWYSIYDKHSNTFSSIHLLTPVEKIGLFGHNRPQFLLRLYFSASHLVCLSNAASGFSWVSIETKSDARKYEILLCNSLTSRSLRKCEKKKVWKEKNVKYAKWISCQKYCLTKIFEVNS